MVTSVNSKMTAIADAIRNLLDISGTMGLDAMASNISSITKRGAVAGTISTKSEQYIIPAGYHNGNGTVGIDIAEQAKIIAENIKNGVTILGVSGTASGDAYAVIAVTYPAGSVCTCTDGSKTLKLKDTSGQGFFLIPYAGTWTVTATDGTYTKSESVEITSEGQSESVVLSYTLYLIKDGVLQNGTEFTRQLRSGQTINQSPQVGYYRFQTPSNLSCGVASSSTFDLTEFGALNAILSASGANSYGTRIAIINGAGYSTEASMFDNAFPFAKMNGDSKQTISCDISALSGGNYVGILLGTDTGSTAADVYDLWLE